ncbi:MAG TPA: hypothetical protein VFH02_02295, partial [Jiangellaceae bacterium]|nr:hypothetical protein [Jiangellaceae bacterium]
SPGGQIRPTVASVDLAGSRALECEGVEAVPSSYDELINCRQGRRGTCCRRRRPHGNGHC